MFQLLQARAESARRSRIDVRGVWRDALLRRMLALADALAALLASASIVLFGGSVEAAFWSALFVPVWVLLAKLHGLYDRDQRALRHLTVDELPRLCTWAATGTALLLAFDLVTPAGSLQIGTGFRLWATVAGTAFVLRSIARHAWRRLTPPARTLIVGAGPLAISARRKLDLFPDMHVQIVGERVDLTAAELRSTPDWLEGLDSVAVASQTVGSELIEELVRACRRARVKLAVVPPVRGMLGTAVQLTHVAELPVIVYSTWDVSRSTLLVKRALDIAVSALLLLLLAPVLLLVAAAVKLTSRGPALFRQTRVGLEGQTFRMLKFRTMVVGAERLLPGLVALDRLPEPVFKLPRDPRVTRVGRMLRRTSIDELPQLWNVLRGGMSLVGPRPEEEQIVARYEPDHLVRLQVKPGLTGPMQVNGRGNLTFEERLAVEREYIENLSISRDLRILAVTASTVVTGRGAF